MDKNRLRDQTEIVRENPPACKSAVEGRQPSPGFCGLPREGFGLFRIEDRNRRRRAIIDTFHPPLSALGQELIESLAPGASEPLHAHLPRLDWPRGYQPFCTWLALSRESHGYQAGPQLNVGVHEDHIALRLGWDAAADAFGRFEFLCRHGELRDELFRLAAEQELLFRVYAAAPWPRGSERVFESSTDLVGSFDETHRRGVWWELGRRLELPEAMGLVCSPELGHVTAGLFSALLPVLDRIAGTSGEDKQVTP